MSSIKILSIKWFTNDKGVKLLYRFISHSRSDYVISKEIDLSPQLKNCNNLPLFYSKNWSKNKKTSDEKTSLNPDPLETMTLHSAQKFTLYMAGKP